MTLTQEQRNAIDRGQPVPIVVDGTPCVLVREDVFEQSLHEDSGPRSAYAAVLKALDRDDENTDQYLEYLNESR